MFLFIFVPVIPVKTGIQWGCRDESSGPRLSPG